jgi:hypothetical protein
MFTFLPWPTLKSGDHEESEHGVEDVVVVKAGPLPHPLLHCALKKIMNVVFAS